MPRGDNFGVVPTDDDCRLILEAMIQTTENSITQQELSHKFETRALGYKDAKDIEATTLKFELRVWKRILEKFNE